MNRGMVVGVWFGVIDMAVMFWAIICVISFYQQLEEHEYGLLKKTKRALWNFDLGKTSVDCKTSTVTRGVDQYACLFLSLECSFLIHNKNRSISNAHTRKFHVS